MRIQSESLSLNWAFEERETREQQTIWVSYSKTWVYARGQDQRAWPYDHSLQRYYKLKGSKRDQIWRGNQ